LNDDWRCVDGACTSLRGDGAGDTCLQYWVLSRVG
jgi:hypothetical protein